MAELEWRRLGRTEMKVRSLGLGCAFFGGGQSSDRDALEGVRRAIELGFNYIDTSPLYGQSERRVGTALEGGWREKVFLQTKVGTHPDRRHDFSAEATRWSVENSLKLLKTDRLDSVLIHDPPDIEDPLGEGRCLDTLLQMRNEGKLRFIGVGVRDHAFHRRAIETGHVDISLTYLDYTLLSQTAAEGIFPTARKHDVGLILASAQGMGLLAGPEPDDEGERRRYPGNEPVAHRIWTWCRDNGVSVRQMAIQFCLAAEIDGMVMVGPANRPQVEEVFEAATTPVGAEIWASFRSEFGVGV